MTKFRCLDVWNTPHALSAVGASPARDRAVDEAVRTSDGPWASGALAGKSPMTCGQELATLLSMIVVIGGPMYAMLGLPVVFFVFGWSGLGLYIAGGLALGYHPLSRSPETGAWVAQSSLVQAWYRYFSFRVVWCDDYRSDAVAGAPFIGVGAPHGVLPLANMLSVPAANTFMGLPEGSPFVGAVAPIFYNTPFLRYLSVLGTIDCSRRTLEKTLAKGISVGLVADGIVRGVLSSPQCCAAAIPALPGPARCFSRARCPLRFHSS